MRIQHNILSMNAYRNYTNNTSALGKNLEKLSSGYKINRAGDDAAGLAISEKMRAQIKGLEAAQKNVKDGISFVKTAEGAMQEIQDMMSRMKYLATQSANGTYEDEVDRNALQDEVDSLLEEINRIADSANFNDIHMLNGGAGGSGSSSSAAGADSAVAIEGDKTAIGDGTTVAQESTVTAAASTTVADKDKLSATVELSDGTKYTFDFTVDSTNKKLKIGTNEYALTSGTAVTHAELAAALAGELNADEGFAAKFTASVDTNSLKMVSNEAAFGDAFLKNLSVSVNSGAATNSAGNITANKEGKGEFQTFDVTNAQVYDASDDTMKAEKSIFTVNGQKFAFAADADSAKALGTDVNVVITTNTTPDDTDAANMVSLMNQKLGTNFAVDDNTNTTINMIDKADGSSSGSSGGGFEITLQIGDTSDSFNQLKMTIGSMKTTALGVDGLKINTIDAAAAAIQTIKDAINTVSTVRGNLGAYQNRLEHTQNNLSVMTENIQDAESTIRDTDVADEMMAYTKNNILIQSAQAMLAQANAVPQGVLQLLQ